MTKIYFLVFLGAIIMVFWSVRKKFQVEKGLTLKGFFIGLTNRVLDIICVVSAFYAAVYLFNIFGPVLNWLGKDSVINLLLTMFFSVAIIAPIALILKNIVGEKERIFVYAFSVLTFALIVYEKVPLIFDVSECQFDLGIKVYLGVLLVVWICSYWESKLQEKFALPLGFLILTAGFLWVGQSRTGYSWQEYLQEPQIIIFIVALFGVQFLFYKKVEWRYRFGYRFIMFPIFLLTILHGFAVIALLYDGSLSLQELAYRREIPRLIEISVQAEENSEELAKGIGDLRKKVADLQSKEKEGIIKNSEKIKLPFLSKELLVLEKEKMKLSKKQRGELVERFSPDNDLIWALKRVWQDIFWQNYVLPIYNYFTKKGGDQKNNPAIK